MYSRHDQNCKFEIIYKNEFLYDIKTPKYWPIIIIIIIIRKGRQCKAGRERLTPYQSVNPNPTTPTRRMKEEKLKTVGDKKCASS